MNSRCNRTFDVMTMCEFAPKGGGFTETDLMLVIDVFVDNNNNIIDKYGPMMFKGSSNLLLRLREVDDKPNFD